MSANQLARVLTALGSNVTDEEFRRCMVHYQRAKMAAGPKLFGFDGWLAAFVAGSGAA